MVCSVREMPRAVRSRLQRADDTAGRHCLRAGSAQRIITPASIAVRTARGRGREELC